MAGPRGGSHHRGEAGPLSVAPAAASVGGCGGTRAGAGAAAAGRAGPPAGTRIGARPRRCAHARGAQPPPTLAAIPLGGRPPPPRCALSHAHPACLWDARSLSLSRYILSLLRVACSASTPACRRRWAAAPRPRRCTNARPSRSRCPRRDWGASPAPPGALPSDARGSPPVARAWTGAAAGTRGSTNNHTPPDRIPSRVTHRRGLKYG